MNWKITRIEIASFKVFQKLSLELGGASLITLDGPNGFGKTSVFDALELLFTGKIDRIIKLFDKTTGKNKQNYKEDFYRNVNSGGKDIYIKVEFVDGDNTLVLARHSSVGKKVRRVDNFGEFYLYELLNFESNDFSDSNVRREVFIDEKFGKDFLKNYLHLNYLVQGQNEYLFSTKLDDRKKVIQKLIDTEWVCKNIENCRPILRELEKKIKNFGEKERELEGDINSRLDLLKVGTEGVEYHRLSTSDNLPAWDREEPFETYSKEIGEQYLQEVRKLLELLPLKKDIKIRFDNDKIETYIKNNVELLKLTAQLGLDVKKLDELNVLEKERSTWISARNILQKDPKTISSSDLKAIPDCDPDVLKTVGDLIKTRDDLVKRVDSNAKFSAEIVQLKDDIVKKHCEIFGEDKDCPLCGAEYESRQSLLSAIENKMASLKGFMSDDGNALVAVLVDISNTIKDPLVKVLSEIEALDKSYNLSLHNILKENEVNLIKIKELIDRLGVVYSYTDDNNEIEVRHSSLLTSIRSNKKEEKASLPNDWESTLRGIFGNIIEDFDNIDENKLNSKINYISTKANQLMSHELNRFKEERDKVAGEKQACERVREKISGLRDILVSKEREYSEKIISDIELVFHIYSGRLMQNHHRGLGLFIDNKDGGQLRFCTDPTSEYDAILSMSTGQISALSLAFFLSLNKIYSRSSIVTIDDPAQSLDDINYASLVDMLRCEFRDRQIIVSSHEEDISSYMRYRFEKAGLRSKSLNMKTIARDAA